jgi:hypothetical protein
MTIHTGKRKALACAAAAAGVALAIQGAPAANADPKCKPVSEAPPPSDLSPSTQKAWTDFICGGGRVTGGMARMVSGAWIGAVPTIVAGATGDELTPAQKKAWRNWDRGAHNAGHGAAMVVSGVYVGAPGYIADKIAAGATPADLSAREMCQVSFLIHPSSPVADSIPGTPQVPELPELPLPLDVLDLLDLLQTW